jgi:hypothetical protein
MRFKDDLILSQRSSISKSSPDTLRSASSMDLSKLRPRTATLSWNSVLLMVLLMGVGSMGTVARGEVGESKEVRGATTGNGVAGADLFA